MNNEQRNAIGFALSALVDQFNVAKDQGRLADCERLSKTHNKLTQAFPTITKITQPPVKGAWTDISGY